MRFFEFFFPYLERAKGTKTKLQKNALGERGGGAAREAPGGEPGPERRLLLQRLCRRRNTAPAPPGRRRLPSAVAVVFVPPLPSVERGRDSVAQRRVQPEARAAVKDAAGEGRAEAVVKGARALCGEERGGRLYLSFVFFVFFSLPCADS